MAKLWSRQLPAQNSQPRRKSTFHNLVLVYPPLLLVTQICAPLTLPILYQTQLFTIPQIHPMTSFLGPFTHMDPSIYNNCQLTSPLSAENAISFVNLLLIPKTGGILFTNDPWMPYLWHSNDTIFHLSVHKAYLAILPPLLSVNT